MYINMHFGDPIWRLYIYKKNKNIDDVICISHNKDLELIVRIAKYTTGQSRVRMEKNLRAKHSDLSEDVYT